jgi:hypothetical protein
VPNERAAVRSCQEVADAIRDLTPAQWMRLRAIAAKYIWGYMTPEDLVQEACRRSLENEQAGPFGRGCPVHVDIVMFLAGAIRSICSCEYEKTKGRPKHIPIINHGLHQCLPLDPPDSALNAEEFIGRDQDAAAVHSHILSLFDDQPLARAMVEGIFAGLSPAQLREVTGLEETAYASTRRLIRRRIDDAYPGGWRNHDWTE